MAQPAARYGGVQTSACRSWVPGPGSGPSGPALPGSSWLVRSSASGLTQSGCSWRARSGCSASSPSSCSWLAPSAGSASGAASARPDGAVAAGSAAGSLGSSVATPSPGSASATAPSSPAASDCSSAGIGTYFFLASAGRNHRPISPVSGAASTPGALLVPVPFPSAVASALAAVSALGCSPVPGLTSLSPAADPWPVLGGAERNAASASVNSASPSGPAPAPGVSGTSPVSAVSPSRVMSSPSPEPVLGSSVSGLALPSSVAGRDGTRLKYRSGIALRTNSRVARKCPPFLIRR